MLSYRVASFGEQLKEAREPDPEPKGAEVLLRIEASGVCHSDLHLWEGYFDMGAGKKLPFGSALPLTLGHEIAGEVLAVGPEASGVKVGDRRVVFPWIGCGQCAFCRAGDEHLCGKPQALGINRHGGYADRVLVPHSRYLIDFAGVPAELACTLACSGLTAFGALKKVGRLAEGQRLLIVGAGGVGMAAVRLAEIVTGQAPIVADIDDAKLAAAKAAGAAEVINTREDGAAKKIFGMSGGGVAAALDFVGSEPSVNFAVGALKKGGRLFIVGLFGGLLSMPIPMFPFRVIQIGGSYVGSLADMQELVALARSGRVQPIPITRRPLAEASRTLEDLKAGRIVGRVVLAP
ncbi:MAG: alcohol dehydrogenase catalytic domain-containing protein [Alphaproteobacteria bacterium]|nr:alcohol dehydrogenase catalytic domain-containing protein [Alphaproteobacteria bacterium]